MDHTIIRFHLFVTKFFLFVKKTIEDNYAFSLLHLIYNQKREILNVIQYRYISIYIYKI